jgi:hypothetical protein
VIKILCAPPQNKAIQGEEDNSRYAETETKLGKSIPKKEQYQKIRRHHGKPCSYDKGKESEFLVFYFGAPTCTKCLIYSLLPLFFP